MCQINMVETSLPGDLLQPFSITTRPWLDILIDFIDDLPLSNHFSVIFRVVDISTKFSHFFPLSHPYSASQVAEIFFTGVFRLHGLPKSIISDRDAMFTSIFWRELFTRQGTKLAMSSSYYPQFDGQSETVKALESYLRCHIGNMTKSCHKWLSMAEWCYNTIVHSTTKISPFKALYGFPPPKLAIYVPGTSNNVEVGQKL